MKKRALLLLPLIFFSAVELRGQRDVQPVLIHRYEKGYSLHSLEDNAAYLADTAGSRGNAAVRICSKEPMPLALIVSAANPFLISSILTVDYDFTLKRIIYLRSEDCLGSDGAIAATELWAVSDGAALPTSVESIKPDQVSFKILGRETASASGARNYRATTRSLITKLRARPAAVGVVLGYYFRSPSAAMQHRLQEVRYLLEQSGISKDRYHIRLIPWTAEQQVDPPELEPRYPSLFIIEVSKDGKKN